MEMYRGRIQHRGVVRLAAPTLIGLWEGTPPMMAGDIVGVAPPTFRLEVVPRTIHNRIVIYLQSIVFNSCIRMYVS